MTQNFFVLITRPLRDARRLAYEIQRHGFQTVLAPMTRIIWYKKKLNLSQTQALIFTSINGVRAFVRVDPRRDLPVYVVGDQTAKVAKSKGFKTVVSADGNAYDLIQLLLRSGYTENSRLVHIGTTEDSLLKQAAQPPLLISHYILYQAHPRNTLPQKAFDLWQRRLIRTVLLFSPRTARLFVECLVKAGCDPWGEVMALCLSRAVAEVLYTQKPDFRWSHIAIAECPRQDAMIDLLCKTHISHRTTTKI